MPSPIGHAIAGVAVAWGGDAVDRRASSVRLVSVCAVLAAASDLDLLFPRAHRTYTHSVVAILIVFIVAASVTGGVTHLRASRYGGQARWRTALICCAAYASHPLLDWLG